MKAREDFQQAVPITPGPLQPLLQAAEVKGLPDLLYGDPRAAAGATGWPASPAWPLPRESCLAEHQLSQASPTPQRQKHEEVDFDAPQKQSRPSLLRPGFPWATRLGPAGPRCLAAAAAALARTLPREAADPQARLSIQESGRVVFNACLFLQML